MKNNSAIYPVIISGLLLAFVFSCKKNDSPKLAPTVTVAAVSSITATTATSGGDISSDGGAAITARGVCWSVNQNPTTADSKTSDGSSTGSFTSSILGLTPGTAYNMRAYAINAMGTSYSGSLSFSTLAVVPVLTTIDVSTITSTTASSGGNITNDGGTPVKARGVCWSTHQNPTIQDSITINGLGLGSFTSSILRLTPGTVYYFRAYAINNIGTGYGNQVTATTSAVLPTITTTSVLAVTSTTATSGGLITSDGGATVTARGVCWSTSQNPSLADNKTTDGTGTSSFTSSITGLTPGMTYYIRAYATNSIGTVYGNQVSTTTTAILPSLTTTSLTSITSTTATGGGNITSDGGAAVTVRGVCWSTSTNPTIADSKTTNGTGTGSFTSSITGLTPGTTYYIRAYATNSIGTAYGNQLTTITLADLPTVTTLALSNITSSTATCGGNIISDGGGAITARGVCWSTTTSPTIINSKTTDGTGVGNFSSSITGLAVGTTYYIRSYATNSAGTAYGNQVIATTTFSLPIINTTEVSDIKSTEATSGGNVSSNGGSAVTARGVCWSTSPNPTIANYATSDNIGIGSFSSYLTELIPLTTYYLRAYAINSIGTVYGNEIKFTTTSLKLGDFYQGGYVFDFFVVGDLGYVAGQTHGLIASVGWSNPTSYAWGNNNNRTYATNTAIGTGKDNTDKIIASQGNSGSYAAKICRDYRSGGYSDWYLPSKEELVQLDLASNQGIIYMRDDYYWSSTEDASTTQYALYRLSANGTQGSQLKSWTNFVRPIRTF